MFKISRARHQGYLTTNEKDLEIKGIWWLPSNTEDKVGGTLTLNEDGGIILDLIGFFDKNPHDFNQLYDYPIIKGYARSGGKITLQNCREILRRTPFGSGTVHVLISCETVYLNREYDRKEEIKFDNYYLDFPYLADWLWLFGFETDWKDLDDWSLTFKEPESYEAKIGEDNIKLRTTLRAGQEGQFKYVAEQESFFEFNLNEPISFDEFKEKYLIPIQNFVSFVTDYANWVEAISSKESNSDKTTPRARIHPLFPFKKGNKNKSTSPQKHLFWLKKTDKEFNTLLNNWFKIHDELESVIDLYFGVLFNKNFFPKSRFLNLCQACESYYAIRKDNQITDEATHKSKIKSAVNKVPKDLKQWVNDNLFFSNYKSLNEQLLDLFLDFEELYTPFISSISNLVIKIKDTRNYYTHYNEKLKNKTATGDELILLSELLSVLIKSHILLELGFSKEEIKELIEDHTQFTVARDSIKKKSYQYVKTQT